MTSPLSRAAEFCERFGLRVPILLAPMAGACPASLSIAVAKAGGMGAAGALLMSPAAIAAWMQEFRSSSNGAVQLNLWIPDPPAQRDAAHEAKVREFLGRFGPLVPENAGDATPPDFAAQCEALLQAGPAVVSSIMGVYPPEFAARMKERGIIWFATVSTVAEAIAAEAAGADVIVAQGAEAGGHRGAFDPAEAERRAVGLFALLPAVAEAVRVPVVAAGGIGDGRGVADALASTRPEDTVISRAFSGRPGRSIATEYALAALSPEAPAPAPYPVQRGLTAAMREGATKAGDVQRMQAWAGQSAALARAEPAEEVVNRLWEDARKLLA
jgi:nitronate monooxygenase